MRTAFAATDLNVNITGADGNTKSVTLKDADSDGYYDIGTAETLLAFAKAVNDGSNSINAELTADIDLTGYEWTTICETGLYYGGYGEDLGYCGTFDGNGHIIKNITVKSSTTMDASCGLFGTVSGTIKNLGVEGFTFVDGGKDIRAGAIVGQLITANGKVSDCYVKGATITPGEHVTGGIAGCVYEGTIENCYVVESTITGTEERFGHVVGDSRGDINESDRPGTVTNCYSDNETLRSDRKGNVINCETKSKEAFASGEVAYLLQGEQEAHVWGQTIGTDAYPTLGGEKVYMLSDGTYSNMMPGAVAQVGRTQYTTVQEAVDNANGSYVKLLADSAETVTATGDLYLDLNGYELAALTVTDGTLYGMDSTTDDYDCADGYGTIGTFTGTYESQHRTDITGAVRRYVAISEDGKLSFHRIYAAVTHTSLSPANAGFGYKASFHGDQMIQKYMTGYGFNVWVSEGNKLSRSATDFVAGADGNIKTLRIKNILSGADTDAAAAQTLIYADAYASLTVNGTVIQIKSDPVSGTLVDMINAVNGNTAAYSTEQLAAVKTMLETYSAALKKAGCEMDNILN